MSWTVWGTTALTALALAAVGAPAPSPETGTRFGAAVRLAGARDTVFVDATDRLIFQPDSVTVRVRDVVTWHNAGVVQHSATADPTEATLDGSARLPDGAEPFNSGLLAEGETYSHTFRVPGRYDYFCMPHEGAGMTGTVIVVDVRTRAPRRHSTPVPSRFAPRRSASDAPDSGRRSVAVGRAGRHPGGR